MKIEKLESFLGKQVEITLGDRTISGKLVKTRTEAVKDIPNLYLYSSNFYCLLHEDTTASVLFRASYVRKLKEL